MKSRFTLLFFLPVFFAACLPLTKNEPAGHRAVPMREQLARPENTVSNGDLEISVWSGDAWVPGGSVSLGKHFHEKTIDIGPGRGSKMPDAAAHIKAAPVRLRIEKRGGGAAHLDSIYLNGTAPIEVDGGRAALAKLVSTDMDVADISQVPLYVSFPGASERPVVSLIGRIEPETIPTDPFLLPAANYNNPRREITEFYSYELGSREHGSSGTPFIKEFLSPGSGHPEEYAYVWVKNDEENLYVTVDFTSDNTFDGEKDYAAVYSPAGGDLKYFKIDAFDETYGKVYFTYTDKVPYQHKLYEFAIPLSELDADDSGEIDLAFALYGTAAPDGSRYNPELVFDNVNLNYLLAYESYQSARYRIKALRLRPDGSVLGTEIDVENGSEYSAYVPAAAFDPVTERYLIVWQDFEGDYDVVKGQLVNSDGSLFGSQIDIGDAESANERNPDVAYDSENNRFLVVWESNPEVSEIQCQLINPDGTKTGSNFGVGAASDEQLYPAVAFNSFSGNFLVVWRGAYFGASANYSVDGRIINAGGSPAGSSDKILSETYSTSSLEGIDLAYSASGNNYLAVFDLLDGDYDNVFGRIVDAAGTAQGGSDLDIGNYGDADQNGPAVIFDESAGNYFVAWEDGRDGGSDNIYAQMVTTGGALSGSVIPVYSNASYAQQNTAAAYNSRTGAVIVGFEDAESSPRDISIIVTGNSSPFIVTNTESYDFGTVNQGESSAPADFTVVNAGATDLSVTDISISGTSLTDFAFDGTPPSAATLEPGDSLSAGVVFSPQSGGAKSVTLTVASNDTANGEQSVEISGEARSIPALVYPENEQAGLPTEVTFTWKTPYAPAGETVGEKFYLSVDTDFTGVTPVEVAVTVRPEILLAGFGLMSSLFLAVFAAGRKRGRKALFRSLALVAVALLLLFLWACQPPETPDVGGDESSYTVSGLETNTTYYWKVEAAYSTGDNLVSEVRSFTTE